MSNVASTAIATSKQKNQAKPEGILEHTPRQNAFDRGTMDLLDEARRVVEGAVGQGQQINPLVYQMLGLQPRMKDRSAELGQATNAFDQAQTNLNNAKQTIATLQAIPKAKRTPQQNKQWRQLKKQMPQLQTALNNAHEALGRIQTAPNEILGFDPLDPNQIPKDSPFSAQNPLNQAQATEADLLNKYLAGGEVDPTLKHQYDSAEQALRAKLSQQYGPGYENSTVGQMALQNFARQKNEAFATWNQQQVEKYNNLAFQGQANLQNLLGNRIQLLQQPSRNMADMGNALGSTAAGRIAEEGSTNQWGLGHGGVSSSGATWNPAQMLGSAVGALGNMEVNGNTVNQWAGKAVGYPFNKLSNWLSGSGAGAGMSAAEAAAADSAGEAALGGLFG